MAQTTTSPRTISGVLVVALSLALGGLSATSASANETSGGTSSATPTPSASPSPSATPQTYQQQLDAYKIKLEEFKVALEKWNALRKAAEDAFKIEMDKFKVARDAWDNENRSLIEEINDDFKKDINKARADFKTAFTNAKSTEAKAAARNALGAATLAATTARQIALEALGEPPTPPTRPNIPMRPMEPIKPIDPALAKNGEEGNYFFLNIKGIDF